MPKKSIIEQTSTKKDGGSESNLETKSNNPTKRKATKKATKVTKEKSLPPEPTNTKDIQKKDEAEKVIIRTTGKLEKQDSPKKPRSKHTKPVLEPIFTTE